MAVMLNIVDLNRIFEADYPVIIKTWVFPLIVGLLSLSMPLLINNIHRVEEKFKRHENGKLVLDTDILKWYKWSIGIAIVFLIVYLLQIPRNVDCGWLNHIVDHSAEILLILAALNFLASVLSLTCFLLKYSVNTSTLYRLYKKKIGRYLDRVIESDHYLWYDKDIAEEYRILTTFSIIEKAFEEENQDFFKEIIGDFQTVVSDYRKNWRITHPNKRHLMVEYPPALRNGLFNLAQECFKKNEVNIQEQVSRLLQIIFFDAPPTYGDVPRYGLSFSSMETLWAISIEAINRNQKEFVKIYWSDIYDYTMAMFHADAITSDVLPHNVNRYQLTDEDKYESSLIAYMHFMLQAYLYEKKEYETLKYLLEYYNGYRDVPELNFLNIDMAVLAYYAAGLSNNNLDDKLPNLGRIDTYLTYSNHPSTSDRDRQGIVLANYIVFLANHHYNATGGVPVCSSNIVQNPERNLQSLYNAFQSLSSLPDIDIYNVKLNKIMTEDEYTYFVKSIKNRGVQEEIMFRKETPDNNYNIRRLYASIHGTLSFEISHHIFVWTNYSRIINEAEKGRIVDVDSEGIIPKEIMIYKDAQRRLAENSFKIAQKHLSALNEKVVQVIYAPQVGAGRTRTVSPDELKEVFKGLNEEERILFFYINQGAPIEVAQKLNYLYAHDRDYISPQDRLSRKSIKCVQLSETEYAHNLENQIWILHHDEQPVVHFIDIENKDGWESLHLYGRKPIDKADEWFADIPIYVKKDAVNDNPNEPMTRVSLKSKIMINGLQNMKPKIFVLE